jgi:hypothetical protein
MHPPRGFRHFVAFVLLWSSTPFAASAAPEEIDLGALVTGQPPGVRQTERLAKKVDSLTDAVVDAEAQVREALAAHDALLFGGATDLRKPYRLLDREIDRMAKRRDTVRRRADEAKAESTEYFQAWAASLPLIGDEELRARSEQRLNDSRSRFDGIVQAGSQAAESFEPLAARLRDQWNYLGHDLNRSGVESLRPDAQTLAAEGQRLLADADSVVALARDYVTAIRARQPPPPPPPPTPAPAAEPAAPPGG